MLALDEFVLWVNELALQDGRVVKAMSRTPGQFKMGVPAPTGRPDHHGCHREAWHQMTYVPYKGGGEVGVQLVGKHVDATVNNPIEVVAQWRAGKLRPLCVFDSKRLAGKEKIAGDMSWSDIPTCKSQGLDIEYLMLRGVFMPAGVPKDAADYYVELFKKVRATPEWASSWPTAPSISPS
jgi:putative tricarboxylic transport membrane protein